MTDPELLTELSRRLYRLQVLRSRAAIELKKAKSLVESTTSALDEHVMKMFGGEDD